jgi:N-acetyl-anhydromuramyl-L-alanine amidase AmpD
MHWGHRMRVRECILDTRNTRMVGRVSLGERIRRLDKTCLWSPRAATVVDTVVVHYVSAVNVTPNRPWDEGTILSIFCELGVSSHYLVGRGGGVVRLVPAEHKAWHAGGSIMPAPDNRKGVNDFSIGIELIATHSSGFTARQYTSLAQLCAEIAGAAGGDVRIVGHEHVAGQRAVDEGLRAAPKVDPGQEFDWERLRRRLGDRATAKAPGLVLSCR